MKFIYGLAAAAALISLASIASADMSTIYPEKPGFAPGSFLLSIDGVKTGFVRSVQGGGITAEVIAEQLGPNGTVKKHLSGVKYEPITIETGLEMGKSFNDWISLTLAGAASNVRKAGAIVACDHNFKALSAQEFNDAILTEVSFPTLDASAKEAASLAITFQPGVTRTKTAAGDCAVSVPGKPKQWLTSNFRLELNGVETNRISKIDSFSVKQRVSEENKGEFRDPTKQVTRLDVSNLKVTFAEASADSWLKWHDDFVIKGNNGESQERQGSIVFLAPDLKTELGRVTLRNVGIFRIAPEIVSVGSNKIRRYVAELYVERMEFKTGSK